jgi:hypothetical protein
MTSLILPLLLTLPHAAAAEQGVVRRALVVGTNDGGGELEPLRYAEQDAVKFADVLTELGSFGAGEVQVLLGPDVAALDLALAEIAEALEGSGESLFLFYYSGHADAQGLRLATETYSYDDLKAGIREVPADVHLGVLDACRSGAISRVKGASLSSPFLVEDTLAAEGEAWLTASSADEDAQESDTLEGSFFTYYLVSGMRGAADAGGDGRVSLNEAYAYAYDRTVTRTGGTEAGAQHPTYDFQLQGNGELKLTEIHQATARITFPEELAGEITVISQPDGKPVAELSKIAGKAATLALEPGRYLLRRRASGELHEVTLSLSTGAEREVTRWGDAVPELTTAKGAGDGAAEDAPGDGADTSADDGIASAHDYREQWESWDDGAHGQSYEDWAAVRAEVMDELTDELGDVMSEEAIEDLRSRIQEFDARESAFLMGGASALFPGAGQAMEGDWVRGALFFGGVLSLTGTGYGVNAYTGSASFTGSPLGPNVATAMGIALYGWAVADAAYRADPERDFARPRTGVTLALESAWVDPTDSAPYASGLSVDWVMAPGISLGLDRTGYTQGTDGDWSANVGGRLMVAAEGNRWRPGAFVSSGARFGTPDDSGRPVRTLVGAGGNLRFYLTPRYYINYEYRYELESGVPQMTHGAGLGVHLGGKGSIPG